ncbi:hypothetical protein NPIL_118891, partial [Nephila pilipes]
MIFCKIHS